MARIAEVAGLSGAVFVVGPDGRERLLQAGDRLEQGETLRAAAGARADLLTADGQLLRLAAGQTLRLDDSVAQIEAEPTASAAALAPTAPEAVLQTPERGVDLTMAVEPTAAGDASDGGGEGNSFVRLLRIVEGVEPIAYEYGIGGLPQIGDVLLVTGTIADNDQLTVNLHGDAQVNEGATAAYVVSLAGGQLASGQSASVQVATGPGRTALVDAESGVDYNPLTQTLTFRAGGPSSVNVGVVTLDDSLVEGLEEYGVSLDHPVGAAIGTGRVTTQLVDTDSLTVNLRGDAQVNEGATAAYVVSLAGGQLASGQSASVQVATGPGRTALVDAESGVDYNPLTQTLTFRAGGPSSVNVGVVTLDDSLVEGPEEYGVSLGNPVGVVIGTGRVTTQIVDNDVLPTVGDSTSHVSEEGLPAGIPDGSGFQGTSNDSSNSAKHLTGNLPLTPNGLAPLTIELINPGAPVVGATALSWAHGSSQAVLIGSDAGGEVIRVTLNGGSVNMASPAATVSYTVELLRPIQHPLAGEGTAGEDVASLNLTVRVSDGINPADTGTITLVIDDDSPLSNPDADSLSSIQVLAETGNVITGEGTAGGAGGAGVDLAGADGGATVSGMVAGTGSVIAGVGLGTVVNGHYGQLSMTADGAYRYQLHASGATVAELRTLDVGESRTDTFGHMIKDADADTSNTTLTLTINAVNDLPTVTKANDNADPTNPSTGNDLVYESHLSAGTNPSAPVVDPQGRLRDRHASGSITLQDPDGLDDIQGVRFQTTVGGLQQTHDFTDAQLKVIVSGTPETHQSFATQNGVVTLTAYNATTGVIAYRFELERSATDTQGIPDPIESNQFTVATKDETASYSQPATVTIQIVDDLPQAERNSEALPTLILDESTTTARPLIGGQADGVVNADANFSGNFKPVVFGADGPASSSSVLYELQLTGSGVASGLFALDPQAADGKGKPILLTQSGNIISGQVDGQTYFDITVVPDGTDAGKVTFTSSGRNIWHGVPTNPDDPVSLTLANPGDLRVLQTVTDGDGDQASDHIDLGSGVFSIQDDGPVTHHHASGQPTDYLSLANGFGTDGGHVHSITLEGATYSWNKQANSIEVTGSADPVYSFDPDQHRLVVELTTADQFVIDMDDGQYDLPFKPSASISFDVGYTLIDNDGDRASSVLHVAYGEDSNDSLQGSSGDDFLVGGEGDDTLAGGLGADVFHWRLGDQGTMAMPTVDHVDFAPGQHDVLDLRDLLTAEHATDDANWNLGAYLSFGTEAGKLALRVDHDGSGLAGVTQKIVFDHFSSTADLGDVLSGYSGTTDADLLKQLVEQGNLKLDP